jgi:lipopolysaccharide transport system ATP-binding protein
VYGGPVMKSISVTGVGKRYRTNKAPSAWQSLKARFGGEALDGGKRSREIWALKDVSFEVEKGTILGVIGPNGAGKTTLLKVLARITPPTEGRIVGHGAVAPQLELGAGLQAELTARENIALYMTWHGVPAGEQAQRAEEIVAFAEIGEFLDTPLKRFSSGMYVRLAFSIAVNMRPEILLADEILAVGDLSFQERCLQRVQEAGAAGMTVFFVSHDMAAIQRLCDRVIWLNAGRIVQDGDPATVVGQYEQAAWTLTAGTAKRGKKGSHASEHGEILSVRLLSAEGREVGAARTDEEVFVTVTSSLLTPGMTARCVMSLMTRGVVAFRTAQPDDLTVTEPGIFTASVRIPADLLADTIYTAKIGLLVQVDGRESTLVQDNALTFRVYAGDDQSQRSLLARNLYQGSAWSGAVMPKLEWQVSRTRDVVTTPV